MVGIFYAQICDGYTAKRLVKHRKVLLFTQSCDCTPLRLDRYLHCQQIHQIQLIQYERQIHHQCADYRCAFGQKVTRQFSLDISKNRNPVLVFLANFLLRKATFWYQYWSYI